MAPLTRNKNAFGAKDPEVYPESEEVEKGENYGKSKKTDYDNPVHDDIEVEDQIRTSKDSSRSGPMQGSDEEEELLVDYSEPFPDSEQVQSSSMAKAPEASKESSEFKVVFKKRLSHAETHYHSFLARQTEDGVAVYMKRDALKGLCSMSLNVKWGRKEKG